MFLVGKRNAICKAACDDPTKGDSQSFCVNESANEQYRTYPIRFYGLTLIGLLNIASSMSWLSVAPVPEYAASFFGGVSLTTINWFSNVFMLAYIFAGPASGFIYDHYSVKVGLVSGAGLQTLGSWLRFFSAFVQNSPGRLALALVGQIVCAIGQPFILNSATPYAALWFGPDGRGSATTVGGLTNAVGMAIASVLIPGVVTNSDDMWLAFLIVACITTGFAVPALFVPSKPKTPPSYSASNKDERRLPVHESLRLLVTNYNFLIILFTFSVMCGLFSALSSLMAQITVPYGLAVDDAGYLSVALIVAGIIGTVLTGIILDKFKVHKIILKTFVPVLGFMYLAFLMVVNQDNFVPMAVVCAIMGYFTFSLLPVALELSVECSYPVSESISSPFLWTGSQMLGLIFLSGMDALRDDDGDPPGNMRRALIMATGLAMPMMMLCALYTSRNKRLESEVAHSYRVA